jgi:hypothetical protein
MFYMIITIKGNIRILSANMFFQCNVHYFFVLMNSSFLFIFTLFRLFICYQTLKIVVHAVSLAHSCYWWIVLWKCFLEKLITLSFDSSDPIPNTLVVKRSYLSQCPIMRMFHNLYVVCLKNYSIYWYKDQADYVCVYHNI